MVRLSDVSKERPQIPDESVSLGVMVSRDGNRLPQSMREIQLFYSRRGLVDFVRASRAEAPAPLSLVLAEWNLTHDDDSPFLFDDQELPQVIYNRIVEAIVDDVRRRFPSDWLRLREES